MSEPTAYGTAKIEAAIDAAYDYGLQTARNGPTRVATERLEANRTENALAEYVAQLEAIAAHHVAGEQVKQDAVDAIREATTQYWAAYDAAHPEDSGVTYVPEPDDEEAPQ